MRSAGISFDGGLTRGVLLRRYKRFLADVRLDSGEEVQVHVANTGSMAGCAERGSEVGLSISPNPKRKLPWSLELVRVGEGWVGVNTSRTNDVVHQALLAGALEPLGAYGVVRREVGLGPGTRIDFVLENGDDICVMEVKNVTLRHGGDAAFPDAVSERGTKHLQELAAQVERGRRAVIFFLVNRSDCHRVRPADHIDPRYGETLRAVMGQGVEAMAYRAVPSLGGIDVVGPVPVDVSSRT